MDVEWIGIEGERTEGTVSEELKIDEMGDITDVVPNPLSLEIGLCVTSNSDFPPEDAEHIKPTDPMLRQKAPIIPGTTRIPKGSYDGRGVE